MLPSINNTRKRWQEFLQELPPEAEIALEVSTSGYFAMSVLEEAGRKARAHWVHTAGIDSLRKQKTDRLDARRLARKLSVAARDPLPEAWFPPPEIRELRMRARQRCWLTAQRAQIRNRVQSLLQLHGLRSGRNPFSAAGQAWLAKQKVPAATRETLGQLGRLHEFLQQEVVVSETALAECAPRFPQIAPLRTIPGLGHILASVVWGELGDLRHHKSCQQAKNRLLHLLDVDTIPRPPMASGGLRTLLRSGPVAGQSAGDSSMQITLWRDYVRGSLIPWGLSTRRAQP